MQHLFCRLLAPLIFLAGLASPAWADVTRVAIASRTVVANGQWFGAAGPYEKIAGTVFFELDPADPHNKAIADIELAPKNARGRVEFSADLFILDTAGSGARLRAACCSRFPIAAARAC